MAVYRNRAHAIAERLILLRKYILDNASPTRAVKATDMLNYLEDRGYKIKIKTLYADLDMLRTCFEVPVDYDKQKKGYIITKQEFEPYELRSIVNSIQAAKFLTQQEADSLTQKIKGLADEHTRPSLNRQTYVRSRARTVNKEMMRGLDTIYEAIARDKKISYKYFEYALNVHRDKKYRYENGSKIITASPYAVFWEDEFFVFVVKRVIENVVTTESAEEEENSEKMEWESGALVELKYMEQIKILEEENREGREIARRSMKHENDILLKKSNEKTKLKISKMYVTDVVDKFGDDVIMTPIDDEFFIATIDGAPTPELYMWTRTFCPCLEIVFPADKEAKLQRYFSDIAKGIYVSPSIIYESFYL